MKIRGPLVRTVRLRYHNVESAQEAVQEQLEGLDAVRESNVRIQSIRVRCGPLRRMFQMNRLDKRCIRQRQDTGMSKQAT